MEHKRIVEEFDALISHAEGRTDGVSIRKDPALGRTLEWLKQAYLDAYVASHNIAPVGHKMLVKGERVMAGDIVTQDGGITWTPLTLDNGIPFDPDMDCPIARMMS